MYNKHIKYNGGRRSAVGGQRPAASSESKTVEERQFQEQKPAYPRMMNSGSVVQVVQCAQACISAAGRTSVDVVYLTGGSSALRPLVDALRLAMPQATLIEGNRFGGVAAGLAHAGAAVGACA